MRVRNHRAMPVFTLIACAFLSAQQPPLSASKWGSPLSAEEKKQIIQGIEKQQVYGIDGGFQLGKRPRALSVISEPTTEPQKHRIATAIFVDYDSGKSQTVRFDTVTNQVVDHSELLGTPQASEDERQDGRRILRESAKTKGLVKGPIEGGFIVSSRSAGPAEHRLLQFQLLSPDRSTLMHYAVVDLTDKKVLTVGTSGLKLKSEME
jgi:hypothetical protein